MAAEEYDPWTGGNVATAQAVDHEDMSERMHGSDGAYDHWGAEQHRQADPEDRGFLPPGRRIHPEAPPAIFMPPNGAVPFGAWPARQQFDSFDQKPLGNRGLDLTDPHNFPGVGPHLRACRDGTCLATTRRSAGQTV